MSNARLAVAIALGLAVGAVGGWALATATRQAGGPVAPETAAPAPEDPRIARLEKELRRKERDLDTAHRELERLRRAQAPATSDPAGLLTAAGRRVGVALDDSASDELAHRAAGIRRTHLAQAAAAEHTAARQIAQETAAERARVADLARGGTMAFMRGLQKDWTPPWETLRDPEAFGRLFERRNPPVSVTPTALALTDELPAGAHVEFPAGRHAFAAGHLNRGRTFPEDLLVTGAGMDATVLVFDTELRVRPEVHSLTFRDVTLFTNDNYLEAMRNNPYTLRLERCRVIGFDMGAGGSSMLSGSVGAFYASDCRIEAGFGRSPGYGNLFDVRGALVSRLERCTIVGPFRSVFASSGRAAQVFDHCRFENMTEQSKSRLEKPGDHIRLLDCTFTYAADGASKGERAPLTDINPAWTE